MSVINIRKNHGQQNQPITALASQIKTMIANQGSLLATKDQSDRLVAGLESLGGDRQIAETHLSQVSQTLGHAAAEAGFDETRLAQFGPGLEAASIILGASGNLSAYANAALNSQASGPNVVFAQEIGGAGRLDIADPVASLEAFDEVPLKDMLDYSVTWNLMAARQDAFGEAHFRTIVVTPELGGIDISVPMIRVFDKADHNNDGKRMQFNTRNLVDAFVDPTVLADQSTRLVPYRKADNSNAEAFVEAAAVATYAYPVAGVSVPTAPLAVNKTVDLIGVSQYEQLIGMGVMEINDAVDKSVKVSSIYVQTAAGKKAIKFNTGLTMKSGFVKGPEGNYRDMILSFDTFVRFNKDSVAVDGSVVTELADLVGGNLTAVVGLKMAGTLNVEDANIAVSAFPLTLKSLKDVDGKDVAIDSGVGATIKAAIEAAKVIGYEVEANRTNSNRRTVGIRLNNTLYTNRYHIPVGSPISIQAPHGSNNDAADLKALIATTRVRNSNQAGTAVLNTLEFLEEHFVPGMTDEEIYATFPGMGRYLVKPYFEKHELDIEKAINSIRSHEKAEDISAVFVQAIRDVAIRMIQRSRYQAALDVLTGGTGELPTLVVGTDQVISRYLIVPGDTRTFGETFTKSKIVVTQDQRFHGKIILTFTREDQDGPDPLSFGNHLWIPELVTTVANVSRGGQQIKETQVQPRTLHLVNCAVAAVIEVTNLHKVVTDKIATPALETDISNPWLNGHTYGNAP